MCQSLLTVQQNHGWPPDGSIRSLELRPLGPQNVKLQKQEEKLC